MKVPVWVWLFQWVASVILGVAAFGKLTDAPEAVAVFMALEMEPVGRYLIGGIEAVAAAGLLIGRTAAGGAILGIGVMLGAIIAHATRLGLAFGDSGYRTIGMLAVVLVACVIVAFVRRRALPLVKGTF